MNPSGVHPLRDFLIACAPIYFARRCHHMRFHRGVFHRHSVDLDANHLSVLRSLKLPIQYAGCRPTAPSAGDRVAAAESLGQATPPDALLGNILNCIQRWTVRDTELAGLRRQAVLSQAELFFGHLYPKRMSKTVIGVSSPSLS